MPSHQRFIDTCLDSYWSAPAVARMKAEGPGSRWAAELRRLSENESVAPLRRLLTEVADDGLRTLEPISRFVDGDAAQITGRHYVRASEFGVGQLRRSPSTAYVITLACVLGWAFSIGDRLTGQRDGMPDFGWAHLPHAYARAALKVGDVLGAQRIVDTAYNTLMAAKYHDNPDLIAGIVRYRSLASVIGRRLTQVIDNLADDLLRSTLHAHLLALMWTLGFVPEAESLRRSGQPPSRPMLRTLIRLSMDRIPQDPLLQYVWLEMKDKPSLDLRGHHFFHLINRRYDQYLADVLWPTIPSRVYARTLVGWMDGSLERDDLTAYLDTLGLIREFEEVRRDMPGSSDWSVYMRATSLAYLLAGEHDLFAAGPAEQLEGWRGLLSQATRMRGRHHLNPGRPDLGGTLNYPLFHLIEHDPIRERIVNDLESYRAAAMTLPLAVTPPAEPAEAGSDFERQLDRERTLIRWLKGAYFLINFGFLPQHFRRYTALSIDSPPQLDLETGLRDYLEVERLLGELYEQMSTVAPDYADRRKNPAASVETITRALKQHRQQAF